VLNVCVAAVLEWNPGRERKRGGQGG